MQVNGLLCSRKKNRRQHTYASCTMSPSQRGPCVFLAITLLLFTVQIFMFRHLRIDRESNEYPYPMMLSNASSFNVRSIGASHSKLPAYKTVTAVEAATNHSAKPTTIPWHIVQAYREALSKYVYQQHDSWNVHYTSGGEKDTRTEAQRKEERQAFRDNPPAEWANIRRRILNHSNITGAQSDDTKLGSGLDDIQWDRESDIPEYFSTLKRNCALNAVATESFDENCWGYLKQLVTQPKCTTSLDSRYQCTGMPVSSPDISVDKMLTAYSEDDGVLTIFIVGAGPVGLFLANALSTMPNRKQEIRIVVFEKRILEAGRKKLYSRDWITEICLSCFDVIDPALHQFLRLVHSRKEKVGLPIQVLETLLLISCRKLGVNFIFEDFQKYEGIIANTTNSIIFDATGHRLDKLERVYSPEATPFQYTSAGHGSFVTSVKHKLLEETGSLLSIATHGTQAGRVSYPVTPSGEPYVAQFLKIDQLQQPREQWESVRHLKYELRASTPTPICQKQHSIWNPFCSSKSECRKWCSVLSAWQSKDRYRDDIMKRLYSSESKHVATQVMFHGLNTLQSDFLWYLNDANDSNGNSNSIIQSLPEIANVTISHENGLNRLLTELSKTEDEAAKSNMGFHLFGYTPYLYTDPLVPGNRFASNSSIHKLRVGDSLASGDPNVSSGLGLHVKVLRDFIRRLKNIL